MTEAHESHAPTLPDVTDEAGDTPNWVPIVGLVLLSVIALMAVMHPKDEPAANDQPVVVEVAAPTNGANPPAANAPAPSAPAPNAPAANE